MSMNAHFNKQPVETVMQRSAERGVFIPESDRSLLQETIDVDRMKALVADRLISFHPHTGESRVAERYFAPSLQRIDSVRAENGEYQDQIVGGWVTKEEARLILTEPAEAPVAPINPGSRQSDREAA